MWPSLNDFRSLPPHSDKNRRATPARYLTVTDASDRSTASHRRWDPAVRSVLDGADPEPVLPDQPRSAAGSSRRRSAVPDRFLHVPRHRYYAGGR